MLSIFDHSNYKKYIQKRFAAMPKSGYGQAKRLAEHLGVSTTFVSQILQGDKSLNLEQALSVAEFLHLGPRETEYFLALVSLERAGTAKLKQYLNNQIAALQSSAREISSRLEVKKVLPDEEKAIFYSDWYYSAVRLLVGIPGFQSVENIAQELALPRPLVHNALQFLLRTGLCMEANGKIAVGPSRTHLPPNSAFAINHHRNWRQKALEQINFPDEHKLHYSAPMTISTNDVKIIRERLLALIEEVGKIIDPSPNQELACLNIDWFRIKR